MISLISAALLIFYLYSAFYIYMLNHRSAMNYVFWVLNINFAITSLANFMLINSADYESAFLWMKIYRYSILPVPILLFLGVLLLAFPSLKKKIKKLSIQFGTVVILLWMMESTKIGDQSFYLFQTAEGFSWQILSNTPLSFLFNMIFILSYIPTIVLSLIWLGNYLKKVVQKFSMIITTLTLFFIILSLMGIFKYFIIVKDGLYDGIFYFIAVGMPISLTYFFVYQERKLPLAMLNSYSAEIVNSLNEGVILFDANFHIIKCNHFAQKFFGWKTNRNIDFSRYQKDCLEKMEKVKRQKGKVLPNQDAVVISESGQEIPISFAIAPVTRYKTNERYLMLFMDITKQRQMEEKLTTANRELNEQIIWRTNVIYEKNNALLQEMDEKEENRQKIEYFLENDYLTALLNKNGFMNMVNFNRSISEQALISVNIMNMKMISETFSRIIAEKVILEIADFLKENWERSSIMARFENYRFLLYCDQDEYKEMADQILQKFQQPLLVDGIMIEVDCGIGIVYESTNRKDINQMIIESDLAANQARKYGKNQYYIYHDDMDTKRSAEFSMLNDYLYAALTANDLELRYDLRHDAQRNVIGLLAEIHWKMNTGREVTEKEIIDIAEMYNFTQELERWRIHRLIRDMKYLNSNRNGNALPVTIRLMKNTLYNERNLNELIEIIEDSQLDKRLFEFSGGEEIFTQSTGFINNCLSIIRGQGIKVGLKNFGGLYSSLKYLRDLEIDFIVLAPEFVEGIGISSRDEAILKMILDLAKNMSYSIMVENVARRKQFDFLIGDCHEFAGLLFFSPSSIEEVFRQLEKTEKPLDIMSEVAYNI